MATEAVNVVASGFTYLVVSQVVTRLITFALTLVTARLLTVEGYGGGKCIKQLLATAALSWPLGLAVTIAVCAAALWHKSSTVSQTAVLLQGTAALLELASEPLYILAQKQLRFRLRVVVEASANIVKAAAILTLLYFQIASEVDALCLAQVAFGITILAGYVVAYGQEGLAWLASSKQAGANSKELRQATLHTGLVDWQVLHLCGSFTLQAAEKLVLAEGSKMVMVLCQSSYNQGVYGLVVNLGSLVVRTLFQPFEEAAFLAFSRQSATPSDSSLPQRHAHLLGVMVKGISIIGLLAATFGPAYSYVALRLVYGRRWSETGAPSALTLYSPYICFLAINGILEAFQHAVATPAQLSRSNAWLVGFSVTHLALSVGLVNHMGVHGLIWADASNMLLRIVYSLWFLGQYDPQLKGSGARKLVPESKVLAAYGAAFVVTSVSNIVLLGGPGQVMDGCGLGCPSDGFWVHAGMHVTVGSVMLGVVGLVVLKCEHHLWDDLWSVRQKQA